MLQRQCPSCHATFAPGNRFCRHCGHNLSQDYQDPGYRTSSQVGQLPPPVLVCPRYFQGNQPDADYCYNCGLPLDQSTLRRPVNHTLRAFSQGSPGGFWLRVLAYLVDSLVVLVAFLVLWSVVFGQSASDYFDFWTSSAGSAEYELQDFGGDVLNTLVAIFYDAILITLWATTLGKRTFGLYVLRSDGSRIGFGRALARNLAAILSLLLLGIGFLMIAFRQDKRGLHDLICDTVVIRRYR